MASSTVRSLLGALALAVAVTASTATTPAPAAALSQTMLATASGGGGTGSGSQLVPGAVNRSTLAMRATYDVDIRLGIAARSVRGRVVITAQNRSGAGVDRVALNTVMGPLGRLRLGAVTVDGTARAATLADQTITVPLGGILPDRATVTIVVPFAATLRSGASGSSWLFTRVNGISGMYRWVPWISRPTPFARPNHGDPFVTPVSPRVTLRIRTDVPVRLAVNADRTSRSADGLTSTYAAANIRDLVVSAASDYRTRSTTAGDTAVQVITRPGAPAAAMLTAATTALRRLEARLGPYPWPVLRIVQSGGGYGMEGPGIVWIPTGTAASRLPYLVTHEVAHQWFYGLVGNDQAREPFADEAAADMVARFVLGMRRASRCSAAPLDRSIARYGATCYYETVYIQGGNLLDDARRRMGTMAYFAALRRYLDDHRWGLVHTRTLLDAIDAATPLDLAAGWRRRFPSLY